jgi:hypothetical protein
LTDMAMNQPEHRFRASRGLHEVHMRNREGAARTV